MVGVKWETGVKVRRWWWWWWWEIREGQTEEGDKGWWFTGAAP